MTGVPGLPVGIESVGPEPQCSDFQPRCRGTAVRELSKLVPQPLNSYIGYNWLGFLMYKMYHGSKRVEHHFPSTWHPALPGDLSGRPFGLFIVKQVIH